MRSMRAVVAFFACVTSSVAMADTVVDMASFSGSADNGALLIGPLFNPGLGTLTGIDLAITGLYNPDILVPLVETNVPTESRLNYWVFGQTGSFGTYNLTLTTGANGYTLSGAAEAFALTINPTDLSDFVALGVGNHNGEMGYINLFSTAANGIWGGGASDLSLYSGDVTITYTYAAALPEPSALSISAVGLLLLAFVRAKGRRGGPALRGC